MPVCGGVPGAGRKMASSWIEITVRDLGRLAAILVVALTLISTVGCGGSGGGSDPTATPVAPTSTATPTAVASSTATPTEVATATAVPTGTATSTPGETATATATPDESAVAKFAEKGPYSVGVTTLDLGDRDVEVWYPIDPGSEKGAEKASYASFDVLPDAIEMLLPADLNIIVTMDAYRDLPVSAAGPFPILTFSHGAGGFRQAYSGFLTGIASHGFVVASLDHLEWGLLAQVGLLPEGVDRDPGEVVLAAIERLSRANADESSPLFGGVDATRVATSGHSAGGRAAFALPDRPEIKAMIGYATGNAGGVVTSKPILLLAGAEDAGAGRLEDAYDDLTPVKRFVSVGRAGHNSFTDQCAIIYGGNNFLVELVAAGFPIPPDLLELAMDGCRPENLAPAEFWKVAQHFTVAQLRAAFGLDPSPVGLGDGVASAFGDVIVHYRQDDGSAPARDVMGFVVSGFGAVTATHDGDPCPGGFNLGPVERQAAGLPALPDDCDHPEANEDPDFKTLDAPGTVDGVDMDGRSSTKASAGEGECAHDDFVGPDGMPGIDLQLWRAVGCVRGFQPGEITDVVVDQSVRAGSMTILIEVRGVDDWQEDDSVRVQVFASTDAPPLGGDGSVLPYGTLSAHEDPRYHSEVGAGRIENGVLTAGPMDVRVRLNIQIVAGDLTFHDARLRMEVGPDGTAHGQIFGFQPIGEFYDLFGRQAGQDGAAAIGYTCSGLYGALSSQADGDFDPATGQCSSISVGYHFEAVPAFIAR